MCGNDKLTTSIFAEKELLWVRPKYKVRFLQNGLLQGTKTTLRGTEREKKLHRNEGECYAHLNMLPCYKSFLLLKRIRLWDNRI